MLSTAQNPVATQVHDIQTANPANPGAGNPVNWPCPVNARVRITTVQFILDNTIGLNIHPEILIISAGTTQRVSLSSRDVANFTTTAVSANPGFLTSEYSTSLDILTFPLPPDIFLEPDDILRITTLNISAQQTLTDIYIFYDQWIIA